MPDYRTSVNDILQKRFTAVYLLHGEERYLQEEIIERLKINYLGPEEQFGYEKVDGSSLSLAEIIAQIGEKGIFSTQRLLVVDNPPYLGSSRKTLEQGDPDGPDEKALAAEKEAVGLLEDYIAETQEGRPGSVLVFTTEKADRRKRIYKLIEKKGSAIECSTLKGEALVDWIRQKTASLGKTVDRSAMDKLLLAGNHNLHYLSGELEKYSSYLGDSETVISGKVVDLLFSGDLQGNVFKLADALAERNLADAENLLQLLLGRREKPLLIFFMLARHYRLLLKTRCLLDEGLPPGQFASTLEVPPFVARKLQHQAGVYNRTALEDVIIILQESDHKIKTGRLEPGQALALIMSRIDYLQTASR
jgi:DNA polymerase III subunit delta